MPPLVTLNQRSNEVRQARASIRRALAAGEVTIADVMRNPPEELGDRALFEILLMARNVGRRRLRDLNGRAVADGINLALTLEDADEATREWIAANALHGCCPLSTWARLMQD